MTLVLITIVGQKKSRVSIFSKKTIIIVYHQFLDLSVLVAARLLTTPQFFENLQYATIHVCGGVNIIDIVGIIKFFINRY